MRQSVLPFQYAVEQNSGRMTSLSGLPAYVVFAHVMILDGLLSELVRVRQDKVWHR